MIADTARAIIRRHGVGSFRVFVVLQPRGVIFPTTAQRSMSSFISCNLCFVGIL